MMKETWMEGDAENGTALGSRQDRVGKVASSAHDTPATHEYDFYSWVAFMIKLVSGECTPRGNATQTTQ